MNIFRRKPQLKGEIGYYGLADWWLSIFTELERAEIESSFAIYTYKANGQKRTLTEGEITSGGPAHRFLSGLSLLFDKTPQNRDIARRILKKSVELAIAQKDFLAAHFVYVSLIKVCYRDRDELPNALDEAIKACEGQIAIAPQAAKQFKKENPDQPLPRHSGYSQLLIIYEKQKRYDDAISLVRKASQEWSDKRDNDISSAIEKYEKLKAKLK